MSRTLIILTFVVTNLLIILFINKLTVFFNIYDFPNKFENFIKNLFILNTIFNKLFIIFNN